MNEKMRKKNYYCNNALPVFKLGTTTDALLFGFFARSYARLSRAILQLATSGVTIPPDIEKPGFSIRKVS